MERCNSFVRSHAVCAAMILGLLVCCPDARPQGSGAKKDYQPPAPETLKIGQGLPVPLCLSGALVFEADTPKPGVGVEGMVSVADTSSGPYSGKAGGVGACGVGIETRAGGWGYPIIQAITNLSPARDEVARFGTKDDLTAGEALGDDTITSPMQATHVKSSSVVLRVPIAWNGTGNGMISELGTEFWDGDTGVYTARVEDCLSSSDHTKLKQVEDKDGKSIKCTTADGVLGRDGHWYDVSDNPWSSTKYLSLVNEAAYGIPGLPKKTINDTLSIPVDLPVPVNSLRVEFELGIKDSNCSKNCTEPPGSRKLPVYIDPTAKDPYIQSYWGQVNGQNSQGQATMHSAGGPEFLVTRLAIQLPNITVLPAAFVQMKVLPYTIVYRPPGDKSQGVYTTNESYGTSLTTGVSTAIDNTTAFEHSRWASRTMPKSTC